MGRISIVVASALLLAEPFSIDAFVPSSTITQLDIEKNHPVFTSKGNEHGRIVKSSSSHFQLHALPSSSNLVSVTVDTTSLVQFFLETLISYGVPAFFTIFVIGFAAKSFKGAKKTNSVGANGGLFGKNVVTDLYDDLYGSSEDAKKKSPLYMLGGGRFKTSSPKNLGIPQQQYLSITKLNDVYQSYAYSLTAATQSKAKAAAQFRSKAFDSALQRAFDSSIEEISPAQKSDLLLEEKEFLKHGGGLLSSITELQTQLTEIVIKDEMDQMDVEIGEVDMQKDVIDATIVSENKDNEETKDKEEPASTDIVSRKDSKKKKKSGSSQKQLNKLVKQIEKENTELLRLEMEFVRAVIEIMGPNRANGIRSALLGNVAGGGAGIAGGLLRSLQNRPLAAILDTIGYSNEKSDGRNLFVTDFNGDVTASQVDFLREEVTAILRVAKPGDEALLILQTGGGTVTGYGLAASQLQRFKKQGVKLTICVEEVAASGGYMMTCVADKVIASPFAVLGSIGVISDMPNVYRRLKDEGIEFQTVTAGKYKRTLTPTKEVTEEDLAKSKTELEAILTLFKGFVKENRPSLDIDTVATGETWFGDDALNMGLCDELNAVDDVLVNYVDDGYNVYQVRFDPNQTPTSVLSSLLPSTSNAASSTENDTGLVRGAIRFLVKNILPTVTEEIANELKSATKSQVKDRYMMRDLANSSNNIKLQD